MGRVEEVHGSEVKADAEAPGYFHSLRIEGLKPGRTYHLRLSATDPRGRDAHSEDIVFRTRAGAKFPHFQLPDWKGEVHQNLDLKGVPAYVRDFNSLSYVAWPGPDSDDLVDTSKHMSVRYTKRVHFEEGNYVFRVHAYDGVRVLVDGTAKVDSRSRTQGHNYRKDFRLHLAGGEHTIVVEHTMWRYNDWERKYSKHLAFKIDADDKSPPRLLAHGIYDPECYQLGRPWYVGRWSEACAVTVDYGETDRYGQTTPKPKGFRRLAWIRFPQLEVGKTYHYRVTAVDLMGNRTVLPDATFTLKDVEPDLLEYTLLRTNRQLCDGSLRIEPGKEQVDKVTMKPGQLGQKGCADYVQGLSWRCGRHSGHQGSCRQAQRRPGHGSGQLEVDSDRRLQDQGERDGRALRLP